MNRSAAARPFTRIMAMRTSSWAVCSLAALLLAGCAVGPDFHTPPAPTVKGYTPEPLPAKTASAEVAGGQAQSFKPGQDIPGQWWALFHSKSLNTLVEQALQNNPDLQAARASLKQAQENVYAGIGAFFPSIDAKGSATRQKTSGSQFGQPGKAGSLYTLYDASVSVSYGIDFFGYDRRQLESLESQADYQRFQLEAAYLTLTSNVVTTAVQEASLRAQIAATKEIIASEDRQLAILQQQYNAGAVSLADVLAQRTTLAQSQASLPPLQKQLAATQNQLATLVGLFPSQGHGEPFDLSTLQLPAELPVSLPSKLVEQRPDIRAAEAQMHDASAKVGVATANMLPEFTITGSYGTVGTTGSELFTPSSEIWNIGAGLLQPIFRGGTLLHERRAAVANYEKMAALYRSTVLAAFQNVADTLRALQSDADALAAQNQAEQAAADSLGLAKDQFEAGAISYLTLLNAQKAYEQTRIGLVQAQATRYADTAALFHALGGGWWNRNDNDVPVQKTADGK
jgi:NodT family efflux transporter outer membrane factor (OMF) lipoprotein